MKPNSEKLAQGRSSSEVRMVLIAMAGLLLSACQNDAVSVSAEIAGPSMEVLWNDDDGTGFAGKGDVQSALSLNNRDLQAAIDGDNIKFQFVRTTIIEHACRKNTNTGTGPAVWEDDPTGAKYVKTDPAIHRGIVKCCGLG
jgi:hypothetical protein